MTEAELRKKLQAYVRRKTHAQAAKEFGISRAYLRNLLYSDFPIVNRKILRKLGLRKVTRVEPI